jgi:hypothetical protein
MSSIGTLACEGSRFLAALQSHIAASEMCLGTPGMMQSYGVEVRVAFGIAAKSRLESDRPCRDAHCRVRAYPGATCSLP